MKTATQNSRMDIDQISNFPGKLPSEKAAKIQKRGCILVAVSFQTLEEDDLSTTARKNLGADGVKEVLAQQAKAAFYRASGPAKDAWLAQYGLVKVSPTASPKAQEEKAD